MSSDRLFILDVSDGCAAGLLCETGKRSLTPLASSHSESGSGSDYFEAVEEVMQRCGARECRGYLALPASLFYFKNLTLPFTDRRKIQEIIHYELLDLVSFGDEPFVYDTVVIETSGTATRLLAAVIKQVDLSPWLELLSAHGIVPGVVTVSPLARLEQLAGSSDESLSSFIYLDAGLSESSFFRVTDGRIDTIRVLSGVTSTSEVKLRDEFLRTCWALEAGRGGTGRSTLRIGGRGAEQLGTEWLEGHSVFAEVEIVDSAQRGLSTNQALQMLPLYLVPRLWGMTALQAEAAGSLNVVQKNATQPAGLTALKRFAPLLLLVLAVLGLAAGYQIYDYQKMAAERARLVVEAEEIYSVTMGGQKPLTDPVAELRARISEIDESVVAAIVEQPEIRSVALLSDISKRMPSSVRVSFERFSFDRKKVRIDGTTEAYNDVDSIKRSLEQSPFFTAVSIDSAGTAGDGSGVKFSISLIL